jgi:hypothetical protein
MLHVSKKLYRANNITMKWSFYSSYIYRVIRVTNATVVISINLCILRIVGDWELKVIAKSS